MDAYDIQNMIEEVHQLRNGHCRDCCCARSWEALGVTGNTGKSIVEHIEEVRSRLALAEKVIEAARKWDVKMDKVHEDSQYVWILANSHGMPYKGATYEKERENVRAALAAHDAMREGRGDGPEIVRR